MAVKSRSLIARALFVACCRTEKESVVQALDFPLADNLTMLVNAGSFYLCPSAIARQQGTDMLQASFSVRHVRKKPEHFVVVPKRDLVGLSFTREVFDGSDFPLSP